MFFLYFVYHILCTMYLYFSVQVSTVDHEWNDDFCACGRPMHGSSVFLLFFICNFPFFCVNYSCCILLYMGSMFIYISLYILWKPAIKTIIIIIIINYYNRDHTSRDVSGRCDYGDISLIARFMGPTWGSSGADRTQVGPMLAPWTLLSGMCYLSPAIYRWFNAKQKQL